MTDGVGTLTAGTFEKSALHGTGPIAVEFMAKTCSHCQALEPILQQAAETLKAKEQIFQVDIETDQVLAQRYDIQGTPTILLFRNGSEVGRLVGPSPDLSSLLVGLTQPFNG